MTAKSRPTLLARGHTREWQNSDSPYELVTVCFWSIVVVSLVLGVSAPS